MLQFMQFFTIDITSFYIKIIYLSIKDNIKYSGGLVEKVKLIYRFDILTIK